MLHATVGSEHLLIGILRVEGCTAMRILAQQARAEAIALLRVVQQSITSGLMNWDETGLAELCLPDSKDPPQEGRRRCGRGPAPLRAADHSRRATRKAWYR